MIAVSLSMLLTSPAWAAPSPPDGLRLPNIAPTAYAAPITIDPDESGFRATAKASLSLTGRHKVVWLDAVDLDVEKATLWVGDVSQPLTVVDDHDRHLGFRPRKPVTGDVVIEVTYSGTFITDNANGVFVQEEAGDRYVLTQFEALDARRAFPCVDDPQFKVPWTLTLDVPDSVQAFANTPVASESIEAGRRVVTFRETRPLPSYLVAFAAGPFDAVDAGVAGRNDTPVRILVPRGRGADARWAAETTGPILETLEGYFDAPYPYAKLDVIAVPHAVTFGAMEHPGLVTFRQGILMSRPEDETESWRRRFAEIQAHELGHQWFGNLVTPKWWDDIWLNESFASWIATRTLDTRWPDWNAPAQRMAGRVTAMDLDGLETSRRIREPITELGDIAAAFDAITYKKGEAVLQMAESWLGEATFRDGVRRYIARNEHGNATADDFLQALSEAAGRDVAGPLRSFLDQPGVPVVSMRLDCSAAPALELSQSRFLRSGESDDTRWQIPICVRHDAGRDCTLLTEASQRLALSTATCPTAWMPNADYVGYYRANVGEAATAALLASDALTSNERIGLIRDTAALIDAGDLPPTLLLDQAEQLAASPDPLVALAGISVVDRIGDHLVPDDQRDTYQHFVRRTYGPVVDRLGWERAADETQETSELRVAALRLVGERGADPAVLTEARRRADRWLATRDGTHPSLVDTALALAAIDGDRALFDTMTAQALVEADRERRGRLIAAIGEFTDPDIVPAVLALSNHDDLDLRERAPLLFGPLNRPSTQAIGWSHVTENIDEIEKVVPGLIRFYIVYLAGGFCSDEGRAEAQAFFGERARRYIGGKRALATTLEQIEVCAATAARQRPAAHAFLRAEAERRAAPPASFEAEGTNAGGPVPDASAD